MTCSVCNNSSCSNPNECNLPPRKRTKFRQPSTHTPTDAALFPPTVELVAMNGRHYPIPYYTLESGHLTISPGYEWSREFMDNLDITSVEILHGVTTIGELAFHGCTSLTSVVIPSSVTNIGHGAFWACENLTSVVIPNSVTTIERGTFQSCKNLTSIVIPSSVRTIGEYAFLGCKNLQTIICSEEMKETLKGRTDLGLDFKQKKFCGRVIKAGEYLPYAKRRA
jgi:hypothetical protein